jgi:hypothetical protein
MKKFLLKQALSKSERRVIWDALHTYQYVEGSQGTLLKSENRDIQNLLPLFWSTLASLRKRK